MSDMDREADCVIWVKEDDKNKFKRIAAEKNTNMKALFHQWVERYDGRH